MTRALLTINFNGALCDNSRRSMQAAAARWGARFWEWNEGEPGHRIPVAPNALKCWAFRRSMYDEILILDADVLVSSVCPSPFDAFTGPELIAVPNGSERFGDLGQIRSCEEYEWGKLLAQEPRLAGAAYVAGRYWNSGMMLARRAYHEAMFALASDVALVDHGCGWVDQTVLNMAAIVAGVPVRLVGEEWNFIHGHAFGRGGPWILHFAGEPGREHLIPTIPWEVAA